MRMGLKMLPMVAIVAFIGLPASAQQQSDWNHPSAQQQSETKDFSQSVKDNLNSIGTAEDKAGQQQAGQPTASNSSPIDKSQIQDAAKQSADVFDSVTSQIR